MTEDACTAHRRADRRRFLAAAGWSEALAAPLAGDASTRSYERLTLGARTALLMNAPPGAEARSCPAGADDATRMRLGYNALARLAGPNLHAFVEIAAALRGAGLSAPEVYAADPAAGFALVEDLGDDLYARVAMREPAAEEAIYRAAVDALVTLQRVRLSPPATPDYVMQPYDRLAMAAETDLLIEWYWPHVAGATPSPDVVAAYRTAWAEALDALSPPHTIVLRDFHAENLLWLPDRAGPARVGLIDFQDGLFGAAAYDLVSLLEDARRDVDAGLAAAMVEAYVDGAEGMGGFDATAFRRDYALLGAQRNAKILGIFARLVKRDGKARYLQFVPRVEAHFRNDLKAPALTPVAAFFAAYMPRLAP